MMKSIGQPPAAEDHRLWTLDVDFDVLPARMYSSATRASVPVYPGAASSLKDNAF